MIFSIATKQSSEFYDPENETQSNEATKKSGKNTACSLLLSCFVLKSFFLGGLTSYVFVGITLASPVEAQNHEAALENYLTDDVLAVAYVDLSQIDAFAILEWAEKLGLGPTAKQRGQSAKFMLSLQGQLDRYAEFGARYVYALFRVSDISHGGPTWVVPVTKAGNPHGVRELILSGPPRRNETGRDRRSKNFPRHCEVVGSTVLGANSADQLALLKATRLTARRDLSGAWQSLGSGDCGFIAFGDADSRRVVRELFPQLPEPFQAIDGPWLADRLQWGGLQVNLPPDLSFQLIAQTDSDSSAKILQQAAADGIELLKQMPEAQIRLSPAGVEALAKYLHPSVSGGQCAILSGELRNDLPRIAALLAPPLQAAREATQRETRMNRFRKIALGMLNYESARRTYPPRSTFDGDGKPLLSWRVHILPYMGGEALKLYKRFHLDEPWDSEHNKQLLPLMPEVYADPDPALAERNAIGRTTYVVPTGAGTLFDGPEGTPIRQVTDGTSNTIMLAEVWSMAGPYWTRPRDWLIDPAMPWERLPRREDRNAVTFAFCDGSVNRIPHSTPDETLRALVTIAGQEVVDVRSIASD